MDIFDIEPNLPGVPADCGHEPSLRELLCRYYGQVFDMEGTAKHADLYIQEIRAKANYY